METQSFLSKVHWMAPGTITRGSGALTRRPGTSPAMVVAVRAPCLSTIRLVTPAVAQVAQPTAASRARTSRTAEVPLQPAPHRPQRPPLSCSPRERAQLLILDGCTLASPLLEDMAEAAGALPKLGRKTAASQCSGSDKRHGPFCGHVSRSQYWCRRGGTTYRQASSTDPPARVDQSLTLYKAGIQSQYFCGAIDFHGNSFR